MANRSRRGQPLTIDEDYEIEDSVQAVFPSNGKWYPAIIKNIWPTGEILVEYEDTIRKVLRAHQIRGKCTTVDSKQGKRRKAPSEEWVSKAAKHAEYTGMEGHATISDNVFASEGTSKNSYVKDSGVTNPSRSEDNVEDMDNMGTSKNSYVKDSGLTNPSRSEDNVEGMDNIDLDDTDEDSHYSPDSAEESTDSDCASFRPSKPVKTAGTSKNSYRKDSSVTNPSRSEDNVEDMDNMDSDILNTGTETIATSNGAIERQLKSGLANVVVRTYNLKESRRNYSRPDYCYFCDNKVNSKMSRHLRGVHRKEKAVVEACEDVNKRAKELAKIQLLGNFKHNCKVITQGEGEIVVVKTPNQHISADQFLPCTLCYGFYRKKNLARHVQSSCPAADEHNSLCSKTAIVLSQAFLSAYLPKKDQDELDQLFDGLSETKANPGLCQIIKKDALIRLFAQSLLARVGDSSIRRTSDINNIRTKLRVVARILKKAECHSMSELLIPKNFNRLVEASKSLAEESDQLGLSAGSYIKQINMLKLAEAIKSSCFNDKQDAENFRILFDAYWTTYVSSIAGKRQRIKTLNQFEELPLSADLQIYSQFLRAEIQKETVDLPKLCLSFLIFFNKRRPREVAEIKVVDFLSEKVRNIHDNQTILSSLDVTEAALAKRMTAIEVRGKSTRGIRKVFVVIPDYLLKYLDQLASTSNTYLFQSPNAESPLSGTGAVRETVGLCPGLQKPHLLQARKFRKMLATECQIMNMKEGELQMIADHLGHSKQIHTSVYRLQENLIERSKMARVLIASEMGTLSVGKNTQLSSIPIEDIPITRENDEEEEEIERQNEEHNSGAAIKVGLMKETAKRVPWSTEESDLFLKEWKSRPRMPSAEDIQRLMAKLPSRTKAVLRARAANLMKKF